jgi:hypothetical protein
MPIGHFTETSREPPGAASARAREGKSGAAFRSARYGEAILAMMAPRDAASWPPGPRSRVGWRQRAKAPARSCRNAAPPLVADSHDIRIAAAKHALK